MRIQDSLRPLPLDEARRHTQIPIDGRTAGSAQSTSGIAMAGFGDHISSFSDASNTTEGKDHNFSTPAIVAAPRDNDPETAALPRQADGSVDPAAAARKFEGILISGLIAKMREAAGVQFFGEAPGAQVFDGLFDQYFGDSIASAGGFGLAKQVEGSVERLRALAAAGEVTNGDLSNISEANIQSEFPKDHPAIQPTDSTKAVLEVPVASPAPTAVLDAMQQTLRPNVDAWMASFPMIQPRP